MSVPNLPILAGLFLLLGACEARIGKGESEAGNETEAAEAGAAGKSEAGKLSIEAPGFDMKINIPEGLAEQANMESDSELIYPGSTLGGMHIEAGASAAGQKKGAVELRFESGDPLEKVAGWYRDPARSNGFAIASASREGPALLIKGTQKSDGDAFDLRLSPRSGGGTEGRLTLSERR